MKKKTTIVIVPHTHWDKEWYYTFPQFRLHLIEVIDNAINLLKKGKIDLFVLDGQYDMLNDYLETRHQEIKDIEELVKSKKLIIGPWFTQPDEFLATAEGVIRNLELGIKKSLTFGNYMKCMYLPDSFGHISQIPQIAKKFNIKYGLIMRGLTEQEAKSSQEFYWESPDGSKMLLLHPFNGYANAMQIPSPNNKNFIKIINNYISEFKKVSTSNILIFMNGVDHFPPDKAIKQKVSAIKKHFPDIEIKVLDIEKTGKLIENLDKKIKNKPLVKGELRSCGHEHTLWNSISTRMDLKIKNTTALTTILFFAEPISVILEYLKINIPYKDMLSLSWKYLLQSHHHDSICSTSTDKVHKSVENRIETSIQFAEKLGKEGLKRISGDYDKVNSSLPESYYISIFNSLPWERSNWIEVTIPQTKEHPIALYKNKKIPYIILNKSNINEIAEYNYRKAIPSAFPSMKLLLWVDKIMPYSVTNLKITSSPTKFPFRFNLQEKSEGIPLFDAINIVKTKYFKITIQDIGIKIDYKNGTSLICNLFSDIGDVGDEYIYLPPLADKEIIGNLENIEIIANNSKFCILDLIYKLKVPYNTNKTFRDDNKKLITIKTRLKINNTSDVINFEIIYTNHSKNHLMLLNLMPLLKKYKVFSETSYDVIERKKIDIKRVKDNKWIEPINFPFDNWICVQGEKNGFVFISPEIREGWNSNKGLYFTLSRHIGIMSRIFGSSRRESFSTPDSQLLGKEIKLKYSIFPINKNWKQEKIWKKAYSTSIPIMYNWNFSKIKKEISLFEISGKAGIGATIPIENGFILRLWNPLNKEITEKIKLNFTPKSVKKIKLAYSINIKNIDTTKLKFYQNIIFLKLKKKEIVSILIEF